MRKRSSHSHRKYINKNKKCLNWTCNLEAKLNFWLGVECNSFEILFKKLKATCKLSTSYAQTNKKYLNNKT
jgi:hypothetical protein